MKNRKRSSISVRTIVAIILALGGLITGILIAALLKGKAGKLLEKVENVLSFGFLK